MLPDNELVRILINEERYNLDTRIYRVFRMDHFKDLIFSSKLVLVNPTHWDDPFENFVLKTTVIDSEGTSSLGTLYKTWYGQCWTDNGQETEALWRIYSPGKDGIRVATTIRSLLNLVVDRSEPFWTLKYFLGKVEYFTREEIETFINGTTFLDIIGGGQNKMLAKLFCVKREEFQHEQEIRLMLCDVDHSNLEENEGLYRKTIDCRKLIDGIVVDPRMDQETFEELEQFIRKEGLSTPVSQSELYKINLPPIRLGPGS